MLELCFETHIRVFGPTNGVMYNSALTSKRILNVCRPIHCSLSSTQDRQIVCACILHNLLIDQPVPPDWFNKTIEELDQDDELNQPMEQSSGDTRCNQVFAYMLNEH